MRNYPHFLVTFILTIPKNTLIRDLPDEDKMRLALQWLRENPTETPTTQRVATALRWRAPYDRLGDERRGTRDRRNRLEGLALTRFSAPIMLQEGMGATKQIMFSCAMWLRAQEGKTAPSWRWFQLWLKNTPNFIPSRRNRLRGTASRTTSANGSRRNTRRRSNTRSEKWEIHSQYG